MTSRRRDRINSALLGDARRQAWSNLGLWREGDTDYRVAAQALALQLAEQMPLQADAKVLDVACGYGTSLNLWYELGVRDITGLEPQTACVHAWQADLRFQCWLDNMQNLNLRAQGQTFEAIIAIDAAYQWDLQQWLQQAHAVLRPNGRLGFHFLLLADDFAQRLCGNGSVPARCCAWSGSKPASLKRNYRPLSTPKHLIHGQRCASPI